MLIDTLESGNGLFPEPFVDECLEEFFDTNTHRFRIHHAARRRHSLITFLVRIQHGLKLADKLCQWLTMGFIIIQSEFLELLGGVLCG